MYSASYAPPTATRPVLIAWDDGTIGGSAAYSWTVPGTHTIAVTVANPCGSVEGMFAVDVQALPVYHRIYLPLIVRTCAGRK